MTRKQFEALAKAINGAKNRTSKHAEYSNLKKLCYDIIEICEEANPNFDSVKFLEAVNKPKEPSKEIPKRMEEKLTIPNE